MSLKEPDYVMLTMNTYGTLETSEGSDTQRRYKGSGREVVTKHFNYHEVFGNHFHYPKQVDNNNNCCHYPISVERNWATTYWPDRCQDYFLALRDFNANYLVDGADVEPPLDFRSRLR